MDKLKQEVPTPQDPQVQEKSHGSKMILVIFGAVTLILIGVGAYVLGAKQSQPVVQNSVQTTPIPSPTPDPTANWKTLINDYGFSLKYPSSLRVLGVGMQVDEISAPEVIISKDPDDSKNSYPTFHVSIVKKEFTSNKDLSLESIAKANYEANQANKNVFVQVINPISQTTLDGQEAYTYTLLSKGFSGKGMGWGSLIAEKLKVIESEYDNKHIIIVYSANDSTFDQILATFKFTDQNQTLDTANWKTYTNTKLEIIFKYPHEWKTEESFLESITAGKKQYSELPQRIEIEPNTHTDEGSVIFITYKDNPNNLSLKELEQIEIDKNKYTLGGGFGFYSPDDIEVTTPLGIKAYYSEKVACSPTGCESYIIPHKDKVFLLRSSMRHVVPNQKNILDQILSTFKFTN